MVDAGGRFVGVVSSDGTGDSDGTTAGTAANTSYPTVSSDASVDSALDAMVSAAPTGYLSSSGTGSALRRTLRLLTGVTGRATLIEATVGEGSRFAGVRVGAAPWPAGAVALSIDRRSQLLAPAPDPELQPGDVVVVVGTRRRRVRRVCELANGIIRAQRDEIAEMDWLSADIAENGEATTRADADARPVPKFSSDSVREDAC